jgi:hypothetical protein
MSRAQHCGANATHGDAERKMTCVLQAAAPAPPFPGRRNADRLSRMNEPGKKPPMHPEHFPQHSDHELRELKHYFEIALEIVEQDSIPAGSPIDISESISTLKERSNSKVKDQS